MVGGMVGRRWDVVAVAVVCPAVQWAVFHVMRVVCRADERVVRHVGGVVSHLGMSWDRATFLSLGPEVRRRKEEERKGRGEMAVYMLDLSSHAS